MESNPYSAPSFDVPEFKQKTKDCVFPTGWRIGRLRYLALLWLNFSVVVLFSALSRDSYYWGLGFFGMYLLFVSFPISVLLPFLRTMDCGIRAYWGLVSFVPVIGFFFGLGLMFSPGSKGDNRHGAQPLEKRWISGALLTVATALFVSAVVLIRFSNPYGVPPSFG